jgi:hypothetical protein
MKILFAMSAIVLMTSVGRSLPHIIPVPIVALALFTAVYLSKNRSAALVFFGGLFISDLAFGLHDLIPVVYASLVPVLFIGFKLRENLGGIEIARASVVSSLVYFLLTNLGVWRARATGATAVKSRRLLPDWSALTLPPFLCCPPGCRRTCSLRFFCSAECSGSAKTR